MLFVESRSVARFLRFHRVRFALRAWGFESRLRLAFYALTG